MGRQPAGKICGVCGQDCSGRPRIKDPSGHYFCKGCYEQAVSKKHTAKSPAPTSEPIIDLDPAERWDPFGDAQQAPQHATASHQCPTCGQPVQPGAALCTNCGYNIATGQQLHSTTKRAENIEPRRAIWPTVIGAICLVFVVISCLDMAYKLGQPRQLGSTAFTIGLVLRGLVTLWLAIGAIGLMQRQQGAVESLRRWAAVQIIIGVSCVGVPLLLLIGAGTSGGGQQVASAGFAVMVLVAVLAVALFWPIFLLIWFSRDFVKQEVGSWR